MKIVDKLFVATFCFCMVVFSGKTTAQTVVDQGTTGSLTWVLTSDDVLTISGNGTMPDYSPPDYAPWYSSHRDTITKVIIGNGVTSIGHFAFLNCSNLKSVMLGNGITNIGDFAFSFCGDLTSVTIPSSVTSIKQGAFHYCSGLNSVTVQWTIPLDILDNVFGYVTVSSIKLYVPKGTFNAYSLADVWKKFQIEEYDQTNIQSYLSEVVGMYPNPTTGELRITNYEKGNIEIFDTRGKKVGKTPCVGIENGKNEVIIDISHLPAGIYFLRIDGKTTKFVKE